MSSSLFRSAHQGSHRGAPLPPGVVNSRVANHRILTRQQLKTALCPVFANSGSSRPQRVSGRWRLGEAVVATATNMTAPYATESDAQQWKEHARRAADALQAAGVECVAFDMDQTIISKHSRGSLRRTQFLWFCNHVTPAFVALVPELKRAGIKMAIATASDKEEYRPNARYPFRKTPETHMLGEDLVVPLLKRVIPEYADDFFIVAYNPKARGAEGKLPENQGKRKHIKDIGNHYHLPESSILLFDDEDGNHRAHRKHGATYYSVKVKSHGLQLPIVVQQLERLTPEKRFVDLPHQHQHHRQ